MHHVFFIGVKMAWLVLEGLDRVGKSTVAELYKKRGYKVIHFSAPSKKYKEPGYAGPSYLDDILDMLMECDNKDTVFDRSWYGEAIWPHVYGRDAQLSEEDIEVIQEFEQKNSTERILMIDSDAQGHWQRCVDNKEPLTLPQFKMASALFNKMAHKYGFLPRELKDFRDVKTETTQQDSSNPKQEGTLSKGQAKDVGTSPIINVIGPYASLAVEAAETELDKLEKANAIRDVLSKRLLKQKGGAFDKLEDDLKAFLKTKLSNIFSDPPDKVSLSEEEITILKLYCKQLKEKVSKNNDAEAQQDKRRTFRGS
jgi:hypothetical protein